MHRPHSGFTLLELLIVLALVALLSMIAMPNFMRFFAKAKRAEAYTQLRALYIAEKAYYAENQAYTTNLSGPDSIGWKADGVLQYTYGFGKGTAGKNYVVGGLKAPVSALKSTFADAKGFKIGAAGDIDGDGDADLLIIDQSGQIKIEHDDLQ